MSWTRQWGCCFHLVSLHLPPFSYGPDVEDPASGPATPGLSHPELRQSPFLSISALQWGLKLPWQAPRGTQPQEPKGKSTRPGLETPPLPQACPAVWEVPGAPWLYHQEGSLSAGRGRGRARATPARSVLHCLRPAAHHLPTSRCAPGGPVLTCPFPSAALTRTPPRGGQMCGLWCWRLLMRSRCLAWPGPAAAAATKGEGGPGREEPGCSWTRGAGGGMRREESPLECKLGWLCLNKDLASLPAASQTGRSAPPGGAAPCTGLQPSLCLLNNLFFFFLL